LSTTLLRLFSLIPESLFNAYYIGSESFIYLFLALYNFTPSLTLLHGLKLNVGDTVQIHEENSGIFYTFKVID